jgi:hypothetical protein
MQLDSLLRSVNDHCTGIDRVVPIVYASTTLHENAYWKLAHDESLRFTELRMQVVDSLGAMVAAMSKGSDYLALAVDDQIFYAPSDFSRATKALAAFGFSWSWRLGKKADLDHDSFDDDDTWQYSSLLHGDLDYGYMFHCDGMVIKTSDYVKMLDKYLPDWRTGQYTPNDLEAAVAVNKSRWAPAVLPHRGPRKATCITWQLNRVQTSYGSPAAEIPATNVDALAKAYLDGKRVDNEKLYKALRENPFQWNPPGARPTHVWACEEASKFWASAVR